MLFVGNIPGQQLMEQSTISSAIQAPRLVDTSSSSSLSTEVASWPYVKWKSMQTKLETVSETTCIET